MHVAPFFPVAEPLTPALRRTVAVAMVALHVGAIWALAQMAPTREVVGEVTPIMVDLVAPPHPEPPKPEFVPAPPAPPEPVEVSVPPEPPQPVELLPPPKQVVVVPPKPTKRERNFVAPAPKPRPKPRPQPEARVEPEPQPAPPTPAPPTPAPPPQSAVAVPLEPRPSPPAAPPPPPAPAPKSVSISAVSYRTPPVLRYPTISRRMQEQGRVEVRVLVDANGLPRETQVVRSSGYPRLDESALATARATRFKPYAENGVSLPFRVVMPMVFELRN